MSGYDHKIETSLEGIENLSKEKNEEKTSAGNEIIFWSYNDDRDFVLVVEISPMDAIIVVG